MKVSFDFTADDLADAAERAAARSRVASGLRSQGLLSSCLLSAVVAWFVVSGSMTWRLAAAAIAAALCAAIYPFSAARLRKAKLRQYFREQFGGYGPHTCEVELTPAGLVTVQAGSRATREWQTIVAVVDTADSVDFVAKGSGSVVVRNRAFKSAEQRAEFLKLALSYANRRETA